MSETKCIAAVELGRRNKGVRKRLSPGRLEQLRAQGRELTRIRMLKRAGNGEKADQGVNDCETVVSVVAS